MAGEVEIHQLAASFAGILAERLNQRSIIINAVHLPNDIIAGHDPPKNSIQSRQPGADLCVNRRHHALPEKSKNSGIFYEIWSRHHSIYANHNRSLGLPRCLRFFVL